MKKPLLLSLILSLAVFLPAQTHAHYNGQPIFKINEIYAKTQGASATHNDQEDPDIAPENYEKGQLLEFEVDTSKLPSPKSVFDKTTFVWDFGDGTPEQKTEGIPAINYTYASNGSYTLSVMADYKPAGYDFPPQVLDKVKIAVGSNKSSGNKQLSNYTLPVILGILAITGAGALLFKRLRSMR